MDILSPEVALKKNVAQELYITIQKMNLEDKTHAGKLHPIILQKLDDDDDQPMLRLHVVMPFHKGDPMSINVEANQISFVNLGGS